MEKNSYTATVRTVCPHHGDSVNVMPIEATDAELEGVLDILASMAGAEASCPTTLTLDPTPPFWQAWMDKRAELDALTAA